MKKLFLLIVSLALLVVGCSSNQVHNSTSKTDSAQKSNSTTQTKNIKKPHTREISAEEQNYIQLVLNQDYDTLMKLTIDQSNEVHKDYYNIAFSLKAYQELHQSEDESNTNNLREKYQYISETLKGLKYVPDEIKNQINEVQTSANDKYEHYLQLANQEEQNKKANEMTKNPQSVSIGMTKDEVLTQGWGKPEDINRTITANGTTEQWVYPGYRYLYFENGVLVTIQD